MKEIRLTRRSLLQWGATLGGLAAIGDFPFGRFAPISPARAADYSKAGEWIYTCCNMCGGQSGIRVLIQDGVAKKIEPSDFNPINLDPTFDGFSAEKARGGRICSKGNAGLKTLYDPDRLKTPMKRIGARGEGKWQPITWEQAIDEVAKGLQQIKERYGARAVAWFSEDHSFTHIQQDFCKAYGTPNYHNHSNLCDVARKAAYLLTMGDERPLADYGNAKYILLFGFTPLSATKWIYLPQVINKARNNGAKLVVVDPIYTQTAAKADEWVPIRPGTDGAMALSMAHVIIKEKLYDREFVRDWTVGFEEYAKFVADKTPEWAAKITTVPAAAIRRLAREVARVKPACIDHWTGIGKQTNGTQNGRAIALLATLTGNWEKPGTLCSPTGKTGGKRRAALPDWKVEEKVRIDGRGTNYPFAHESGVYVEAREAMLSGQPYPVKGAVFVFQNWVMALANWKKNVEAMRKMEFILTVDTHMSETAEESDIVVPGSVYLERYDINSNWTMMPSTGLRQPVVKSWIGGMTEADFFIAVARKMGFKGFEKLAEELLDEELRNSGMKMSLDEFRKQPGVVWTGGKERYNKHMDEIKMPEGGSIDPTTGTVKDKGGKPVGVKVGEKLYRGFNTPSGKQEFYSAQLAAKGFNGLPEYKKRMEEPDKEYPFYLTGWYINQHTHTRTFNNAYLMEMEGDNPIWMNPRAARKLGLKDGDEIWIASRVAKARGTVKVTERVHPEVLSITHGFGHTSFGRIAKGKGTADGLFPQGNAEPISGHAAAKEAAVKITKA